MAETKIEWADQTVNAWEGCAKKSPACKHCYAEHDTPVRVVEHAMGMQCEAAPQNGKIRLKMWGEHNPATGVGYRVETVGWEKKLLALNRKAERERLDIGTTDRPGPHRRPRVFINSLSDTFEGFEGPVYRKQNGRFEVVAQNLADVRKRLFAVLEECDELDIILLTKRPENVLGMVPDWWHHQVFPELEGEPWPSHIWMLTTVENQEMADERIPELLRIPAKVRGLSVEPLLGPVNINFDKHCPECRKHGDFNHDGQCSTLLGGIHWCIVGGESGHSARPMHPDWVRSIRDQCVAAGVSFFFKQFGEYGPPVDGNIGHPPRCVARPNGALVFGEEGVREAADEIVHGKAVILGRHGKKAAGRILDGRTWDEMPK